MEQLRAAVTFSIGALDARLSEVSAEALDSHRAFPCALEIRPMAVHAASTQVSDLSVPTPSLRHLIATVREGRLVTKTPPSGEGPTCIPGQWAPRAPRVRRLTRSDSGNSPLCPPGMHLAVLCYGACTNHRSPPVEVRPSGRTRFLLLTCATWRDSTQASMTSRP